LSPASDGFFVALLFDPKDGGEMFLRNVELSAKDSVTTLKTVKGKRPWRPIGL
jgi:hypothetical protein